MPERGPALFLFPRCNEHAVAEVLDARSASVRDVAYGEGRQFSIGRGDARLEIFPRTGVTRLTAQDVRVELFGGADVQVSGGGIELSRSQPGQDASLTVVPGGGIVFSLVAGGERRPPVITESGDSPAPSTQAAAPALRSPETPQKAGTDAVSTSNAGTRRRTA